MSLKCGIVGLPNVGKSTLFNALSGNHAAAANFPFCTIEPNKGMVAVPDERLTILQDLVQSKQVIPAVFEFVDIAGLVKGASSGEGLGNKFLAAIREVNAIIHIVRCFDDNNVVHVDGKVDPIADKEIIDMELQLKDLESIDNKIQRLQRLAKGGGEDIKHKIVTLKLCSDVLAKGKNLREVDTLNWDEELIKELQLITDKPIIYIANIGENDIGKSNKYVELLRERVEQERAEFIVICASIEAQIASFSSQEDKQDFLQEYGLEEPGLKTLIRAAYHILGFITYFTAGEQEVRAWPIRKGWTARQAAGVIHSDFEKKFIKAEVIKLSDYQIYKTEATCREAGKVAIEGKQYVVEDGDVMHFKSHI